jgi:hypothetical protein
MTTIAFDIDDTLYKIIGNTPDLHQAPDYDLIQVLRILHKFGARIYIWSAGGVDYATTIVKKLGLWNIAIVIPKGSVKVDICFDDQEVKLGLVNFLIDRKLNP